MKKVFKHFVKAQYWYLSAIISIIIVFLGFFRFPNFLGRLVESVIDFGTSCAYVFCNTFEMDGVEPTVNNLPDFTFFNLRDYVLNLFKVENVPNVSNPTTFIPSEIAVFSAKWKLYWQAFVSEIVILRYIYLILYGTSFVCTVLLFAIPIFFIGFLIFKKLYYKQQTQSNITDSRPLRVWRWSVDKIFKPIIFWCVYYVDFLKNKKGFLIAWLIVFLLYFNAFTIFFEFVAYYLYFAISFDFANLYKQVYKLFLDLWAFFTFMPVIVYVILAIYVLSRIGRKIAYNRLRHNERRNRGFINELGVVTYIYAEMGGNKTSMLTDMALSMEVQLRDDALEVILECDACFPNFPWLAFERELKKCYAHHVIYDKWSALRWVNDCEKLFLISPLPENIFGYEFDKYSLVYDNNLFLENIWDVLRDYALAYTIYTTESSLIVSNYSIRVDSLLEDLGNFPLWNCDFFARDSRLIDSFSRHSHILDFDMIRLGNQMIKDNPNRNAFGWGVWIITEADKEFKNTLELQEIKGNSEECNQKNDLTHVLFKMSRHACYVRHRNFVRIGADMQRIENITANLRGIGQVALIEDSSADTVVLPFFSPYKIFLPLLARIKSKLDNLYLQERFLRSDNRLLNRFFEYLRTTIARWFDRTNNLFGIKMLNIELQSGRMEGKVKSRKYYLSFKKGRSKRNGSDCMSSIFESRGANNLVGLNDMQEYADYIATQDELLEQHSYTQNDLEKYRGDLTMSSKTDIKATEKLLSANVEGLALVRGNKITLSDEAVKGSKILIKELCGSVIDWVDDVDGVTNK